MNERALAELRAELPSDRLIAGDELALDDFAGDESSAPPVRPTAVVLARERDDVRATMAWASRHGVPVTPRGAGTGRSGGCVPTASGVVLSLAGMDRVQQVRPEHGWAEVEPGVVTGRFREAMESEHRLFYPPDPASLDECTLGGNVATNAGGPVAVKYGVTGRWVLGLEAVLADGSIIETGRRQPKGVAGYDLTSLLVGSEGTLGVVTSIRLALAPRPSEVATALLSFGSVAEAVAAVQHGRSSGLLPRALELFDRRTTARLARHEDAIRPEWGALLLTEFDGEPGAARASLDRFVDGLPRPPDGVLVAPDEAVRQELWALRRRASKVVKIGAVGWISEDVAVPLGNLPAMTDALEPIGERHGLVVLAYGHAGDGNLHVNLLWEDDGGPARAEAAADEVVAAALELGGTISGEHGLGCTKSRFLPLELGSRELGLMRTLKRQWDPAGILNPGKVLP
jgi:glycolate oxidase